MPICSRLVLLSASVAAVVLLCALYPALAQVENGGTQGKPTPQQDSYAADVERFAYSKGAPLDVKELASEKRGAATVHDITYVGQGDTVPAYLVVPATGRGPFAAILWGHWMMPHSPTANRREFLDEAVALAASGVVSLLIDTPQVRPDFASRFPRHPGVDAEIFHEQLIDLRRGLELLSSRADVDPKRMAFVGHSFDSSEGAVLDAVDKRPAAFVFMGGPTSMRAYAMSDAPQMVAVRKQMSPEALNQYLQLHAWIDPGSYAAHLGPAPALFQYGLHDEYAPVNVARQYFAACSGPKEVRFYDSGHALNAEARRDRIRFLDEELGLPPLSPAVLEAIPATQ